EALHRQNVTYSIVRSHGCVAAGRGLDSDVPSTRDDGRLRTNGVDEGRDRSLTERSAAGRELQRVDAAFQTLRPSWRRRRQRIACNLARRRGRTDAARP